MEDLDREREAPGAADAIVQTLREFGFESDEAVVYQSERGDAYRAALQRLAAAGDAYACWCSRNDLEVFGGLHPPRCVASARPGARPPGVCAYPKRRSRSTMRSRGRSNRICTATSATS